MNLKWVRIGFLVLVMETVVGFPATALAGDTVAIDVPAGKECRIQAFTNTPMAWEMVVSDGPARVAVLQGRGTGFDPMKVIIGNARFTVKARVQAKFASYMRKVEVKIQATTINNKIGDPRVFGFLISGEDGDDEDWQDVVATITCLHSEH